MENFMDHEYVIRKEMKELQIEVMTVRHNLENHLVEIELDNGEFSYTVVYDLLQDLGYIVKEFYPHYIKLYVE